MKKVFYLSSCSSCKKILKFWQLKSSINIVNIKKDPISKKDLESIYKIANSYEVLFNKRAQLFRKIKKESKKISEKDYKDLILAHYSFLKRPLLVIEEKLFMGNSKETVIDAKIELDKLC